VVNGPDRAFVGGRLSGLHSEFIKDPRSNGFQTKGVRKTVNEIIIAFLQRQNQKNYVMEDKASSSTPRSNPIYHKKLRGQIAQKPRFVRLVDLRGLPTRA